MTTSLFNQNSTQIVRLIEAKRPDLWNALDVVKGWGFEILETGEAPFGESQTDRHYAVVKLPEGWRSFGSFSPAENSNYMDSNGALRLLVTHREFSKGRIPESYRVSFYDRFSLSPAVTEGKNGHDVSFDRSILRDNKTGEEFEIGPGMGLNTESEIQLGKDNLWKKTLLDLFAPDAGDDPTIQKLALAHMWDQDIKLNAQTAESIRHLVLDALYKQKTEELARNRGGLIPG